MKDVPANFAKLPNGWWRDPFFAEPAYRKIDTMLREGYSHTQIAIEVGCSSRAVNRYSQRKRHNHVVPSKRPGFVGKPRAPRPQKLTVEAVQEIRQADRSRNGWKVPLVQKYGINPSTVLSVVRGDIWAHVPFEEAS